MSLLLLAVAVLVWPTAQARRRLGVLRRGPRWKPVKPTRALVVVAGGVLGIPIGVGGVIAGVLLAATVWRVYREAVRHRARLAASAALADGLKGFVAELRSGAHPAKAALGAAEDAEPPAAGI
ncbi:MAG: type II secretion system protein, partial [Saccharothrix sp.]|nr:type II secretion system protein [Saccharothrix sp.]